MRRQKRVAWPAGNTHADDTAAMRARAANYSTGSEMTGAKTRAGLFRLATPRRVPESPCPKRRAPTWRADAPIAERVGGTV